MIRDLRGRTDCNFHVRNDATTKAGSDLFPWDTGAWDVRAPWGARGAMGRAHLDPSKKWIWNGRRIRRVTSEVSFVQMSAGWTGQSALLDELDLVYGAHAEVLRFDGDFLTDQGEKVFGFSSIWFVPHLGLEYALPWNPRTSGCAAST